MGSLKTAINAELYDGRISVSFHDFDVTTDDKNKPNLQNADIITMHYFMEEVYSERNEPNVVECFDYILQTAKPGALFLYSGMFMYGAIDWVHQLFNNCELLTPGTEPPHRWYQNHRTTLTEWIPCIEVNLNHERDLQLFDDIKGDLERFYDPKEVAQRCHGKVIYRLYRKVNNHSHWYW
ncbi:uncharacterized protein LOC118423106 isoform X2 [Branchiostoma floridae]|uniref:Uncharacterized protein LOC118423106 isoform X2 n=1 Tax=Branchiostoma floridae TaxID=7739 RepID=A0A9J7LRD5_BRAFL|nr:uncharacterized protein LOC118423106 isoform X2 [Branchiostoma floridae]